MEILYKEYEKVGLFRSIWYSLKLSFLSSKKPLFLYTVVIFFILLCYTILSRKEVFSAVLFFEVAFLGEYFRGLKVVRSGFFQEIDVAEDVFKGVGFIPFLVAFDKTGVKKSDFRRFVREMNGWGDVYLMNKGIFERPFFVVSLGAVLGVFGGLYANLFWELMNNQKLAKLAIFIFIASVVLMIYFSVFASSIIDIKGDRVFAVRLVCSRLSDASRSARNNSECDCRSPEN